jgi:hypothetical protein
MHESLEVLPRKLVLPKRKRKNKTSALNATSLGISLLTVQKIRIDHPRKLLARKNIKVNSKRGFLQLGKI